MRVLEWRAGQSIRLDLFLRKMLCSSADLVGAGSSGKISNSKIRRLIFAGAVSVRGDRCRVPALMLRPGDMVLVRMDEEKFFYEKPAGDIDFTLTENDVLYEDDSLIIVSKPAFIPTEQTVAGGRANMHDCVVDFLWRRNPALRNPPYAGIMHRLDRETSGALLFTKTRSVNAFVHAMFETRSVKKTYRAVCSLQGAREADFSQGKEFSVHGYMSRVSPKSSACMMGLFGGEFICGGKTRAAGEPSGRNEGQYSETDFRIFSAERGLLYVDCFPKTGRTHQIRVHLKSAGLPILGDELYGGKSGFEDLGGRVMLHALGMEFRHPVTNEPVRVIAPPPDRRFGDFTATLS